MNVSIWTDVLALRRAGRFNQTMSRNLPYVLAAAALLGLLAFAFSRIGAGPDITGPAGAEVVVADVPNPVGGPPATEPSSLSEPPVEPSLSPDEIEDLWAVPPGFRQLLDRDAIFPIYDPEFVTAAESEWPENTLVVGVALNGEARAYPVGHLNQREMVIDTVGGIPVLVTW